MDTIYYKYFHGIKMHGILGLKFLKCINGTIVYLTCAILCHALWALQIVLDKKPLNFNPEVVTGERV